MGKIPPHPIRDAHSSRHICRSLSVAHRMPACLYNQACPSMRSPSRLIAQKSRIRNCCADPARNKLCHTGTARKASVPVMILCRNSITDTGADDHRPCEAVRSDSCTFFLLKCPAKPFRRIETTACGIFLLFLVCHRITPAGGDVNPFLISQFSQPLPLSTHRSFPAALPPASFR